MAPLEVHESIDLIPLNLELVGYAHMKPVGNSPGETIDDLVPPGDMEGIPERVSAQLYFSELCNEYPDFRNITDLKELVATLDRRRFEDSRADDIYGVDSGISQLIDALSEPKYRIETKEKKPQ